MSPRWTESAGKHGIPRADQAHAIANANYVDRLDEPAQADGETWLYIGPPHPQTNREIEVLVTRYRDGREAVIFHAMELGPKFRRYREEHRRGD